MDLNDISVTVLTRNGERHLKEVLSALVPFGEVIIYDTESSDRTLEIARRFENAYVVHAPFIGYGPTHNMATASTNNDWVLSINGNELVSEELVKALSEATLDPLAVYSFPRLNYYNGKLIKWCGWHPDRKIKLYNKQQTRFTDDTVHESVMTTGMRIVAFQAPIRRTPYHSMDDFLQKMQSYSSLYAEQNRGRKNSSLPRAWSRSVGAFLRSYFLKGGILGGYEGFVISAFQAHMTYYKYLKLHEVNKKLCLK